MYLLMVVTKNFAKIIILEENMDQSIKNVKYFSDLKITAAFHRVFSGGIRHFCLMALHGIEMGWPDESQIIRVAAFRAPLPDEGALYARK